MWPWRVVGSCFWLANVTTQFVNAVATCVDPVAMFTMWCYRLVSLAARLVRSWWQNVAVLIQENQELGRQLSQGRIAQLEAELCLAEEVQRRAQEQPRWWAKPFSNSSNSIYGLVLWNLNLTLCCHCFVPVHFVWSRAQWLHHSAGWGGGGHAEHYPGSSAAAEGDQAAVVSDELPRHF